MQHIFPELRDRLPILPERLLREHHVFEEHDSRFKAAARLLQGLWREDRDLPIGTFTTQGGKRRKLGSLISEAAGATGANFLTPDIARLAAREVCFREHGALIDQDRLQTNLLSSMPLAFNIFGPLKLDLSLATDFVEHLWPSAMDKVKDVLFEHSPGRGDTRYTDDFTAFDVAFVGTTEDNRRTFITVEVKYAESCWERVPRLSGQYEKLPGESGLYREAEYPKLREAPLQQLWREHLLAYSMVANGLYENGIFAIVAPRLNHSVQAAAAAYKAELTYPELGVPAFNVVTLEDCIATIRRIGSAQHADALHRRYTDFDLVEGELDVFLSEQHPTRPNPVGPAGPVSKGVTIPEPAPDAVTSLAPARIAMRPRRSVQGHGRD